MSLIQSLEADRVQYLKDFGSNRFSFVRDIAEWVIEQNNLSFASQFDRFVRGKTTVLTALFNLELIDKLVVVVIE
jgi:hypothetical protein